MTSGLLRAILCGLITIGVSPSWAQQTVTVCSGEYEKFCHAHDSYVYCDTKMEDWATNFCKSAGGNGEHRVIPLNTYGGNKCGYSIDRVVCL